MATRSGPSQDMLATIRPAQAADVPALTRVLVRAYMDDPVAIWICGSSSLRAQTLAVLYSARLRQMLAAEGVWTNAERTCAAVWTPPDHQQASIRPSAALLRCLLDPRLMVRLPLLASGFLGMQRAHPQQPHHWYLSLVGTDPDARGRGLGSAVLQPVFQRCDRDGVGAYLESSKPRNLDFYAHFGFHTTGELQLPFGPPLWPMWREPHGARG
jgi:GNAT superfamily N-acetyltransferase